MKELMAIDIETYDPELVEKGSGVYRKDGNILGVAYKTTEGEQDYIDLGHRGLTEEQRNKNLGRVRDVLSRPIPKIGANISYDLDWLINGEGIHVVGPFHDVQIAEPLIDENALSYRLESLGQKYLKEGKKSDTLKAWCDARGLKGEPIYHLYRMTAEEARPYALGDVDLPLRIFEKQHAIMEEENLISIYNIEIGLIPLLLKMRKVGVRIDRQRRDEEAAKLRSEISRATTEAFNEYGPFNINSTKQIAEICDKLRINYGTTAKGNPTIKKEDLESIDHPFAKTVLHIREMSTIYNNFLAGAFVEYDLDGRIHCDFYQLRRDEGGTVSGRFSSQHPNLQQVPKREESKGAGSFDFGAMCRGIFLPEEGCWYASPDYSQIEYRVISHYARGPGSDRIREEYQRNPKTDYHQLIMDMTGVDRTTAKRLNFGMAYFMGAPSMSKKFGWSLPYAEELSQTYHELVPFMKPTRSGVVDIARGRGYIRTILGRRARVSEAMRKERKEYAMFNRLIQGSAADINKKALHDAYIAGLFDVLTPHITVHDELGTSVPKTKEGIEAYEMLIYTMENAVKLRVPIVVEPKHGESWGTVDVSDFNKMRKEIDA